MPHRVFYNVDLAVWVYGTIEKCRQGESWRPAWIETYREIGGVSETSGEKSCPMMAARTLYEYGRLKNGGLPFRECEIPRIVELFKERDVRDCRDEIATRECELEQEHLVAGGSTGREARGGRGTGWFESGWPDANVSTVAPWAHQGRVGVTALFSVAQCQANSISNHGEDPIVA